MLILNQSKELVILSIFVFLWLIFVIASSLEHLWYLAFL